MSKNTSKQRPCLYSAATLKANANNEDRYITGEVSVRGKPLKFFCVFDGHGGQNCSVFLAHNFQTHLQEAVSTVFMSEPGNKSDEMENGGSAKEAFVDSVQGNTNKDNEEECSAGPTIAYAADDPQPPTVAITSPSERTEHNEQFDVVLPCTGGADGRLTPDYVNEGSAEIVSGSAPLVPAPQKYKKSHRHKKSILRVIKLLFASLDKKILESGEGMFCGSCALCMFIYGKLLYVANTGDSRAILGSFRKTISSGCNDASRKDTEPVAMSDGRNSSRGSDGSDKERDGIPISGDQRRPREEMPSLCSIQLTRDQDAANITEVEKVKKRTTDPEPFRPSITNTVSPLRRVAGSLMVTRAMGDGYLKEIGKTAAHPKFVVNSALPQMAHLPYITSHPVVTVHPISWTKDQFVVLASDGLYNHAKNEEIVNVVNSKIMNKEADNMKRSAGSLIEWIMRERIAPTHKLTVDNLLSQPGPSRRRLFDDTTVIIIFLASASALKPSSAASDSSNSEWSVSAVYSKEFETIGTAVSFEALQDDANDSSDNGDSDNSDDSDSIWDAECDQ